MGTGASQTREVNFSDPSRSEEIDKQLKEDAERDKQVSKLLLLGAGESGKSTILKQMRILHDGGFTKQDFENLKSVIRNNVMSNLFAVIEAMGTLEISYEDLAAQSSAETIRSACCSDPIGSGHFLMELLEEVKLVWQDAGIQRCFERSSEYQLDDSTAYFLTDVVRIASKEYLPSQTDILNARLATCGIVTTTLTSAGRKFKIIDVGGQRTQRRKWIHCFDNVNGIIFLVAVSEYDQRMREDNKTNRLLDALAIYKTTVNSRFFINAEIILFLNKKDIFEQKILKRSIHPAFPEYSALNCTSGGQNYDECSQYILNVFVKALRQSRHADKTSKRQIHYHFTCATDTHQTEFVLTATLDRIKEKYLQCVGVI